MKITINYDEPDNVTIIGAKSDRDVCNEEIAALRRSLEASRAIAKHRDDVIADLKPQIEKLIYADAEWLRLNGEQNKEINNLKAKLGDAMNKVEEERRNREGLVSVIEEMRKDRDSLCKISREIRTKCEEWKQVATDLFRAATWQVSERDKNEKEITQAFHNFHEMLNKEGHSL